MGEKIADIHENINQRDWINKQIAEVYSKSNSDLSDLKSNINDSILEDKLTINHVINVLKNAQTRFTNEKYTDVVTNMWAGLTLSIQIALQELWFDPGAIDGVYMNLADKNSKNQNKYANSKTRKAVKAFQKANELPEDWWAGKDTITKILEKLDDTTSTSDIITKNLRTELSTNNNFEQAYPTTITIENGDYSENKKDKKQSDFIHIPETFIPDLGNIEQKNKLANYTKQILGKYSIEPISITRDVTEDDDNIVFTEHKTTEEGKGLKIAFDKEHLKPILTGGNNFYTLHIQEPATPLKEGKWILTIAEIEEVVPVADKAKETPIEKKEETETNTKPITPAENTNLQTEITHETGLNGNELANENYNELKDKLIGINGEIINFSHPRLKKLQDETKTQLFCFDWTSLETQTIIEKMLAPVIVATGDMPHTSVHTLITSTDTDYSWSVSYSIKDIAETLNVILKWVQNNPELKDIDMTYFKKFCKYLSEKKLITYSNGQYVDNKNDDKQFINVLFSEIKTYGPAIKINGKEGHVAESALHELRHAEFEAKIANNQNNYNELKQYFNAPTNIAVVSAFLTAIYGNEELPYTWHFNVPGETLAQRKSFIENLERDPSQLQTSLKSEPYSTWNTPEFNLLTEFWAYTHDGDNSDVEIISPVFSWEHGYNKGIEEWKAIIDQLSNLKLPNGWTWLNKDKKVSIDTNTYNKFYVEILSNETTPSKYKLNFDAMWNFIDDHVTWIYNWKSFKFALENWEIILKKIENNDLSQNITDKMNKLPEQLRFEFIKTLKRIQDRWYDITINQDPVSKTSSNWNIREYSINGNFSLSDSTKWIIDNPAIRTLLISDFWFESINNIELEWEKIKSFDFVIAEII